MPPADASPLPTTLVSFDGTNGQTPLAALVADAQGDLFGTTSLGGAYGDGTIFEIAKTATGYAATATTLLSFNGKDGSDPVAALTVDAAGDLFGTTEAGGTAGDGTVFELANTASGYASAPSTLTSFNAADGAAPAAALLLAANGNLFGTTSTAGPGKYGTLFELIDTAQGYASTPLTLLGFNLGDGATPLAGLISDAAGDLFGTTSSGGADGAGEVVELVKTSSGYAAKPAILASFAGQPAGDLSSDLVADANGDLFGITNAAGGGDIFEIAKTTTGYAAYTVLTTFAAAAGDIGGLVIDVAGDLFGTTATGGANNDGTVFELADTAGGYSGTATTLASFDGADGADPLTLLASGALVGTTEFGGSANDGTVFEIASSPFQSIAITGTTVGQIVTNPTTATPFATVIITDDNSGQTETLTVSLSAAANGTLSNLGSGSYNAATGVYTDVGTAAVVTSTLQGLVFTPTLDEVPPGQLVTTGFTITDTDTAGSTVTDSSTNVAAVQSTLTTLASFDNTDGYAPVNTLLIDPSGNLYGETFSGAADGDGVYFELPAADTDDGFSGTIVDIASHAYAELLQLGTLAVDTAGAVFLTSEVQQSGVPPQGFLVEITPPVTGIAGSLYPVATLPISTFGTDPDVATDAAGDVFGISGNDLVEVTTTPTGYAGAAIVLAVISPPVYGFNFSTGLLVDANGDIFGSSSYSGTIFELVKTSAGYANAPIQIAPLPGGLSGPLVMDSTGDLFGAAEESGTVFEIDKTASGYASTASILASATLPAEIIGGLLVDAAGNLFGTTYEGGAYNLGSVFELAKTASGYGQLTTLLSFDGIDGANPESTMTVDAAGDLLGTTATGGANNDGTIFKLADSGYQVAAVTPTSPTAAVTLGTGPDTLALQVNEDFYITNAAFSIFVDGTQIGGIQTATAQASLGQTQTFDIEGTFNTAVAHTVSIDFLNDAASTPYESTMDRNLYVNSATIDGTTIANSALSLLADGTETFSFGGPPAPPPPVVTVGTGGDTLALSVSEDAWQGDAQFTLSVDGKQQGATFSALASHAAGQSQTFDVLGNLAAGTHIVTVDFLNDLYSGPGFDRNLYVGGATFDGAAVPNSALTLLSNGSQSFTFTK